MTPPSTEHIPESFAGAPAMLPRTGAPRSAAGSDQATLAGDVTHVIHSWIEQFSPAGSHNTATPPD